MEHISNMSGIGTFGIDVTALIYLIGVSVLILLGPALGVLFYFYSYDRTLPLDVSTPTHDTSEPEYDHQKAA